MSCGNIAIIEQRSLTVDFSVACNGDIFCFTGNDECFAAVFGRGGVIRMSEIIIIFMVGTAEDDCACGDVQFDIAFEVKGS